MSTPGPATEQVVILAGGLGTRLRPITEKIPKPMVPVAGEPFLHWQLSEVARLGFRKVLLLVAYLGEQIEAHFGRGDRYGLEINYSYEPEPLGTGGALKHAGQKLEDSFILLNGDSFLRAPLQEMTKAAGVVNSQYLVSVYDNSVPTPVIPNLRLKPAATAVRQLAAYKKGGGAPEFTHIDSGVYVLRRGPFLQWPSARFQLEDVLQMQIAAEKAFGYLVNERFYDIGTPERLKEFEEKFRDYFPNAISH